jgi:plasmid stability protein
MKQLLVRNIDESLVKKLKTRAVENGISAEELHRRILTESLNSPQVVKESITEYIIRNPVLPEVEIPLERSSEIENRETGF